MKMQTAVALILAATFSLTASQAFAQGTKSDSKVKAQVTADKPDADGKQAVTVKIAIDKGWHIYANPVGNADLTNTQTKLALTSKGEAVKIDYPSGTEVKDDVIGNYKIYQGDVVIKAVVKRAAGDTTPLEMNLSFQACDEKSCLLPATVKLTVP